MRRYAAFAEDVEGPYDNARDDISDTGPSQGAFLPFDDSDDVSTMHMYQGPVRVLDTRVVCVRPNITNL